MSSRCLWCGGSFVARQSGGQPQKFCQPLCRRTFHDALRAWAQEQWAAGHVTTEALKVMLDQRARCSDRL